jgi:hypothetical protein
MPHGAAAALGFATCAAVCQVYEQLRERRLPRNPRKRASGVQFTEVLELTQSRTDAKQLFDQMATQQTGEGFVYQPNVTASWKVNYNCEDEWVGLRQGQTVAIYYYADSGVSPSWGWVRTSTSIRTIIRSRAILNCSLRSSSFHALGTHLLLR